MQIGRINNDFLLQDLGIDFICRTSKSFFRKFICLVLFAYVQKTKYRETMEFFISINAQIDSRNANSVYIYLKGYLFEVNRKNKNLLETQTKIDHRKIKTMDWLHRPHSAFEERINLILDDLW